MDFDKLAQIRLINGGGGGDPSAGLCIMEMVSYFDGADRVTDHPSCACPVLTEFAIRLNDTAPSQEARDALKPLLPLLAGSRDPAAVNARVRHLVLEAARRCTAPLFDARWPEHAAAIRTASTYEELRDAAYAAAAYAYAYAADADADADVWNEAREILIEAIKLGAHGGLDMDAPATEARAEQLLTLVGA